MFWGKKNKEEKIEQEEQNAQEPMYALVLNIEGVDSQEIPVETDLLVGSSENAQISIEGAELDDQHATFKISEGVLSLVNHTDDGSYIGEQKLQKGKKYVLNHADHVVLGAANFIVKKIGLELTDSEESSLPNVESLEEENAEQAPEQASKETNEETSQVSEEKSQSPVEIKALDEISAQDESSYQTSPTITAIKNTEEVKEQIRNEQKKLEEVIKRNKELQIQEPGKGSNKRPVFTGAKPIDPASKMNKSFSKGSFFPLDTAPRTFSRFYAIVANIFLTYAFIYTLLPIFDPQDTLHPFVANLAQEIFKLLNSYILIPNELSIFAYQTIEFYIFYCALDFFWILLFGISFPFYILGIRTEDSPFLSRVKGFLRVAIGCITTPFLIFDLPILVGYKSVKELVTFTQFQYHSRLAKVASSFFFIPLICLFCLFSPILIHLENFKTVNLDLKIKEEQEVNQNKKIAVAHVTETASVATATDSATATLETQTATPTEIVWQVRSELFGVKAEIRFPENILIIPQSSKGIILFDMKKENVFAEFTSRTPVDFENVLSVSQAGNPLFFLLYPNLYQYLTRSDKNIPPLPDAEKDLHHLIIGAQKLNIQLLAPEEWSAKLLNIATYLIEFGPFLPGYLNVRDEMIQMLQISQDTSLSFLNQKKNDFIRFSPNATSINYVLLTSPNRPHPLFEYNASQINGKIGLNTIRQLLNGDWKTDPPMSLTASTTSKVSYREKLTQLEKENAFALIDFLTFYQKDPSAASQEANLVSNFFRNEFERAQTVPANSLLLKRFKKAIKSYTQELKRIAKPDDTNMNQVIADLEFLTQETPAPMTASETLTATNTGSSASETLPNNTEGNP